MTYEEKLEQLRKVIVKMSPHLDASYMGEGFYMTIRLSDVLRVYTEKYIPQSEEEGGILESNIISLVRGHFGFRGWDMKQDDLDLQSEETIDFLHSILCE